MLTPYATSVAAATVVFAQLFNRDVGADQLGARHWFGIHNVDWHERQLAGADRHLDASSSGGGPATTR